MLRQSKEERNKKAKEILQEIIYMEWTNQLGTKEHIKLCRQLHHLDQLDVKKRGDWDYGECVSEEEIY